MGEQGKISEEDEQKLLRRLYDDAIEHRNQNMKELEARYYPVAAPQTMSEDKVKSSVSRQVDDEMQKRAMRKEEQDQRAYGKLEQERKTKKMTASEIDESVERLYTQSLRRKELNMEESNKKYLFDVTTATPGQRKTMSGQDLKDSANRLSVPKKTTFTTEEINKIYGLS